MADPELPHHRLDDPRIDDRSRTGIENEAFAFKGVQEAPDSIVFLDQQDLVSFPRQIGGRGQTGHAGPNDENAPACGLHSNPPSSMLNFQSFSAASMSKAWGAGFSSAVRLKNLPLTPSMSFETPR